MKNETIKVKQVLADGRVSEPLAASLLKEAEQNTTLPESSILKMFGNSYLPVRLADPKRYRTVSKMLNIRKFTNIERHVLAEMKLIRIKESELSRTKRDRVEQAFSLLFTEIKTQ